MGPDVINAIYAAAVIFIFFYIYKVPLRYYLVILGHLSLVFLTNDFLFPMSYMPDQYRYFGSAEAIRDTMDFLHYYRFDRSGESAGSLTNAALFFSLFPIPTINSVFSISIINSMLYAFLFIFLYRKKILVGPALWFYLLFPSLALYSAMGLRDTIILVIMFLSIYALYKKKTFLSILIASSLLLIKSQNFIIYIAALIVYKSIEKGKIFTVKSFAKLIIAVAVLLALGTLFPLEELNRIRYSMYVEDGGDPLLYIPLAGYGDFLLQGFFGAFYVLLKPFLWESSNAMQLIQSIENMVVFIIIYKIIKKQSIVKDKFIKFLVIYFIVAMVIYGLVVFNFGTVARYRYPFVAVFVVFSLSILYKRKKGIL